MKAIKMLPLITTKRGTKEELNMTAVAQPTMLAHSIGCWRVFEVCCYVIDLNAHTQSCCPAAIMTLLISLVYLVFVFVSLSFPLFDESCFILYTLFILRAPSCLFVLFSCMRSLFFIYLFIHLLLLQQEEVGEIKPTAAIGHSLGEFTAAVALGTLSLADGVRLVVSKRNK